jgi:1,2-diacylglycerol 3-beta-glucosyltransferase
VAALTLSAYLLSLSLAARGYRSPSPASAPRTRVVVLVPAHDEAALIAGCVRSLVAQAYPRELFDVVVVADNCTDATASIAAAAGARVLVRDRPELRGKGHALRWALERVLVEEPSPDAVAVVDADAVADPGFLAVAVGALERGARAVQCAYRLAEDGTAATALRATALLLFNCVRPAGRARLGLPAHLSGSGMLLARELLVQVPWSALTSAEDAEYTLRLRMAGIGVTYAGGAGVVSPAPPNARAASAQQLRWEGGTAHLARAYVPRLVRAAVRRRRPALLDAALQIALPPLSLLAVADCVGAIIALAGVTAAALPAAVLVPWALAIAAIALHVLVGLAAAHAPQSAYRALALAPLFVVRKVCQLPQVRRFDPNSWVRTERAGEAPR